MRDTCSKSFCPIAGTLLARDANVTTLLATCINGSVNERAQRGRKRRAPPPNTTAVPFVRSIEKALLQLRRQHGECLMEGGETRAP